MPAVACHGNKVDMHTMFSLMNDNEWKVLNKNEKIEYDRKDRDGKVNVGVELKDEV